MIKIDVVGIIILKSYVRQSCEKYKLEIDKRKSRKSIYPQFRKATGFHEFRGWHARTNFSKIIDIFISAR